MKVTYIGSIDEAQRIWLEGESNEEFINHILANVQVIHEEDEPILFEGIVPDQPYEMRFGKTLTADDIDPELGTIERTTGEPPVKQEDQANQVARAQQLVKLFYDVFIAAITSGLLIEKALVKACEAIEHVDHIDAARVRVITAQIAKEFGDEQ